MLFKGLIATALSGSMDGITASHNKGGTYFRGRAIPTNPSTSFQVVVRNAMAVLTTRWLDVLTQAERDAWQTYADNVTLTNRVGDAINVSGLNMYVRSNVTVIQIGQTIQDTAPVIFNLGSFTEPSVGAASEASQDFAITFDNTDAWANETGSAMVVYVSRPQNASINFFKGPYQLADTVDGDDTTPPTSPQTIAAPFTIADGQVIFVQVRVCRLDGRLSGLWRGNAAVTSG